MVASEHYKETSGLRIDQPSHFKLEFHQSAQDSYEIELSDEEIDEGLDKWKKTLVGCIMHAEVNHEIMEIFVRANWKQVTSPPLVRNCLLFSFSVSQMKRTCLRS